MDPKANQNGTKLQSASKMDPKWIEKQRKMDPKWNPNGTGIKRTLNYQTDAQMYCCINPKSLRVVIWGGDAVLEWGGRTV